MLWRIQEGVARYLPLCASTLSRQWQDWYLTQLLWGEIPFQHIEQFWNLFNNDILSCGDCLSQSTARRCWEVFLGGALTHTQLLIFISVHTYATRSFAMDLTVVCLRLRLHHDGAAVSCWWKERSNIKSWILLRMRHLTSIYDQPWRNWPAGLVLCII